MTQEERERYLRKVIDLSKDVFILHEWEKEKLDELVRITREENATQRGIEQEKSETVIKMLNKNYSLQEISEITGLSEEEIMKIKESN